MRLYLATVAADDIRWATAAGLIDGIVATPAVLAAELPHADPREVLGELAERTTLPIFASVGSLDPAEIVRGAKALRKSVEHLIVAIPFVEDTLGALRTLSTTGVRCAATLVHSVAQGILAAKAGASLVVLPVDALDTVGERTDQTVADLRAALDRSTVECDIVVAGPANAARFGALATAGADAAVVTTPTLRAFLQHPLTDRGIDRFLADVSRRTKPRRAR
ncbi:MAG: transaldolase family protein [Gemmatimonadaceae bacterium]